VTTRIQRRNRGLILDAALEVFSTRGFRGATLDQIAAQSGLSKPNLLYYFDSKDAIHHALLTELLNTWLDPLKAMNADGEPKQEIMGYVQRKLQMSREFPRESRLFANEILQGAPHIEGFIKGDLRALVEEKSAVISAWMAAGHLAKMDPTQLIFAIWALTQHYADFDAQIRLIRGDAGDPLAGADTFLDLLFTKLLAPPAAA
jgi:TetR/AcrR family transcriptional regulator